MHMTNMQKKLSTPGLLMYISTFILNLELENLPIEPVTCLQSSFSLSSINVRVGQEKIGDPYHLWNMS